MVCICPHSQEPSDEETLISWHLPDLELCLSFDDRCDRSTDTHGYRLVSYCVHIDVQCARSTRLCALFADDVGCRNARCQCSVFDQIGAQRAIGATSCWILRYTVRGREEAHVDICIGVLCLKRKYKRSLFRADRLAGATECRDVEMGGVHLLHLGQAAQRHDELRQSRGHRLIIPKKTVFP